MKTKNISIARGAGARLRNQMTKTRRANHKLQTTNRFDFCHRWKIVTKLCWNFAVEG